MFVDSLGPDSVNAIHSLVGVYKGDRVYPFRGTGEAAGANGGKKFDQYPIEYARPRDQKTYA